MGERKRKWKKGKGENMLWCIFNFPCNSLSDYGSICMISGSFDYLHKRPTSNYQIQSLDSSLVSLPSKLSEGRAVNCVIPMCPQNLAVFARWKLRNAHLHKN